MKKFINICLLSGTLLFVTSCNEDFVDVPVIDQPSVDNYYKSEADVKAATATLYGYPWFEFNDKFFWAAGEELAGNLYHTWDQEGQFFYYSYGDGNTHIQGGWRGLYRVVSYANAVINDMPVFASGKVSDAVINEAIAEARFVRASAYYMLTEFFGEVPIIENSTELITSNNLFINKHTKNSVYEFIKRDLEFAAENLPAVQTQAGRVTSWSAKGMLAKIHVTIAQYLSKTNASEATSHFNAAKSLAQEVIQSSGLQLMNDYGDLFMIANNNNSESLFAMQFMGGAYGIGNSRQANWARSNIITGNTEAWGGYKSMTYDFMENVVKGDKRIKHIIMQNGDFYPEINKAQGGYTYKIVNRDPKDQNVVLESASATLNNLKKYVVGTSEDNNGNVTTGQAAGINQYVLRLADVYLIYVEAAIGLGASTTDATALQYLNRIRSRAGLTPKTTVTFEELLWERRMEFALESLYWFDLKRYYYRAPSKMIAVMSAQKRDFTYQRDQSGTAADENSVAGYILTESSAGGSIPFQEAKINLPIPASEKLANPKFEEPAVEYEFK